MLRRYWPDITLAEVEAAAALPMRRTPPIWPPCKGAAPRLLPRRAGPGGIIVLAGRPYRADPEINHGIDKLHLLARGRRDYGGTASHLVQKFDTRVLNQWIYHARLYAAAKYIADQPDMDLVQLVSFGAAWMPSPRMNRARYCSVRASCHTQLKIDE